MKGAVIDASAILLCPASGAADFLYPLACFHAVRQYKYSRLFKIFRKDIFSASQCRFGSGSFDEINISTMTRYMRLQCIDGSQLDHGWGHFDLFKSLSGFCDLIFQRFCFLLPFLTEGKSVFFEIQYTSNDFNPGLII